MTTKQFFTILAAVSCIAMLACGQSNDKQNNSVNNPVGIQGTSNKFADNIPKPTGYVNDYEKIFSENQEITLDSLIKAVEKQTTIEIAIVTLDSSQTTAEAFDDLTLKIAQQWGVGKKDKDNVILIGLSSSLRKIRIRNGYGIEKVLSSEETKKIIDIYLIPQFKKGNYFEGTRQGILALTDKLK
jgi:uncharacterized protein